MRHATTLLVAAHLVTSAQVRAQERPDSVVRLEPVVVRVRDGPRQAGGVPIRVGWLGSDRESFDMSAEAAPPRPGEQSPAWRPDPDDPRTLLTTLDERGVFLLCAVPTRSQVRVQIDEGEGLEIHRVDVPDDAVVVVTLSRRKAREP